MKGGEDMPGKPRKSAAKKTFGKKTYVKKTFGKKTFGKPASRRSEKEAPGKPERRFGPGTEFRPKPSVKTVALDPDVARVFSDARAVNEALRGLIQIMESARANRPRPQFRAESGRPQEFHPRPPRKYPRRAADEKAE